MFWEKLRSYWRFFTTPSSLIREEKERQQASLLAGLSLGLVLLSIFIVFGWVWANPDYEEAPVISAGVVSGLFVVYLLSRGPYYKAGSFLFVTVILAVVIATAITAPGSMVERMLTLNFLLIAILLAAVLLSVWQTLLFVGLCLAAVIYFFFVPGVPFQVTYSYLVFLVVGSGLLILASFVLNRYIGRLFESQKRYRALFNQSNDAVFILDLNGNHIEVNQNAADMLGFSREELMRMSFRQIVSPDDLTHSENVLRQLLENKPLPIYERTFIRKDGTKLLTEVNVELVRDVSGKPLHVQSIVRDIGERKEAQEKLVQQEEYLRVLIEQTPAGIVVIDMSGKVAEVNPRTLEILGALDHTAVAGRNILQQPLFKEADLGPTLIEALSSGKTVEVENWYTSMWNKVAYLIIRAVPHFDVQGCQIGLIILVEDMTQRVQAVEGMRQMQKMESLSVLAGGIAHDFNNLLVAMLGQTTLALAKLQLESPGRPHVEKAVKAAEQAARLTQQLLAYSGHGQYQVALLNLNSIIEENLHFFAATIPKQIQLRTELLEGLPLVEVDVAQMQQVVMNLILNAAEAIGEERGTITIVTNVQDVAAGSDRYWQNTVLPLAGGRYVTLEVEDDGAGMSPETLTSIFDPFFTTKEKGHGLGLAAVLGIVKGHKGSLTVHSEVGRGTTFRLLLPASTKQETAGVMEAENGRPAPTGVVLVVDDEDAVRDAVTDILALQGIEVLTAADGRSGLALYEAHQHEIDMVLLDLSMPGWSGEQTMHELRKLNPQLRIILSSGYNEVEATRRFTGKGLTGFLQKPYTADKLLETVQQHLLK